VEVSGVQEVMPVILTPGSYARVFTAVDGSGNQQQCSFQIHITSPSCEEPKKPDGGAVTLSCGLKYGSVASYSCSGDALVIGQIKSTCQVGGQWNNPAPVCSTSGCIMSQPDHGQWQPASCAGFAVAPSTTCTLTCDDGYEIIGKSTTTCTDKNTFSDDLSTFVCSK
jgi:hypothetical protein